MTTETRIEVHQFPCLTDNYGFLIRDSATGKVATIDTPDADEILTQADRQDWPITDIWNTHWHPDHAGGNAKIVAATGASVTGPAEVNKMFGPVDRVIEPGDTVMLGLTEATVIDVGGHTLQHIAFHLPTEATAFVGDALFALGCGRLFEGTAEQAWASLSRLMDLPDDTTVYCAHEYTEANAAFVASLELDLPLLAKRFEDIKATRAKGLPTVPTTIGLERATNPFVLAGEDQLRTRFELADAPPSAVFAAVRQAKDSF